MRALLLALFLLNKCVICGRQIAAAYGAEYIGLLSFRFSQPFTMR